MARDLHRTLMLVVVSACTGGGPSPDGGDDTPFIAFQDDFATFRSWRSTPGVGPPGAPQPPEDGGIHDGPLVTYINAMPDAGVTAFPKGTIIVKEPSGSNVVGRTSFAMVKRGAGYNAAGATDWMWYELSTLPDSTIHIVWSGAGPPLGEAYGSTPSICNDCHSGAKDNDFVWTAGLTLSAH